MRWCVRSLGAGLTLTVLVACGDEPDEQAATAAAPVSSDVAPSAPPPSTTPATTPPPTTAAPEPADPSEAVIAAYLGYWEAFFTVTDPGQPDHPIIDRYAAGAAADRLREVARARRAANEAFKRPAASISSHFVTIVEISDAAAVVRDCFVDDSYRLDLTSLSAHDEGVETNLLAARLEHTELGWKLTAIPTLLRQWTGKASCDD